MAVTPPSFGQPQHASEQAHTRILRISTETSELDIGLIHGFLSEHSTWAKGIPRALVERSIAHSLCFGAYLGQSQVAFARVISDYATFANFVDVFVLQDHRGHGYSKVLLQAVLSHPELQGLRRFMLATSDAHAVYAPFGFTPPAYPASLMERYVPGIYQRAPDSGA